VLVDTAISIAQNKELIQWIKASIPGKRLKYIYITHGHGDHFFGLTQLKEEWPDVQAIATRGTISHMQQQLETDWWATWQIWFPNQIALPVTMAQPLTSNTFEIDGSLLQVYQVGHTDTFDTTILHIAELDLVVAGDVVYGDVHQFFGEADTSEKRQEWLRAIELVESLQPRTVVAGHKRPGSVDGSYYLGATKAYIEDFERVVEMSSTQEEIVGRMMELYPNRINPHAIISGAVAAIKAKVLGNEDSIARVE
jgi:glyoxylase-like metal-dependent hydrolase (beta-lactamase superfamily II)